jgi:hypothetical protein
MGGSLPLVVIEEELGSPTITVPTVTENCLRQALHW